MAISINQEPVTRTYSRDELIQTRRSMEANDVWYSKLVERRKTMDRLPDRIKVSDGSNIHPPEGSGAPTAEDQSGSTPTTEHLIIKPESPEAAMRHFNGNLGQLTLVLPQDPASIRAEG